MTRLDIAFAVSMICQFMQEPQEPHWTAALHIIKYLKRYPSRVLFYRKGENERDIQCFVDANWARSLRGRRSTSGYCIARGGNVVI